MPRIATLEEFKWFAKDFALSLSAGSLVGLVGDLGAGKTTFVQEACAALGVTNAVRSPTFVLMQIHPTGPAAKRKGISQVCHVDAYRLENENELAHIGFADYAGDPTTIAFVEWADRIPSLAKFPGHIEVRITARPDGSRDIEVKK